MNLRNDRKILLLGLILVITLISYWPVFINFSFVWDDEGYITANPLVHDFRLKEIFTTSVMGNYHPITVCVLAAVSMISGGNAVGFHIFNLLLHLFNVFLVYYVIARLSQKTEIALLTALLFGIHPVHVEPVAWISGLKDLLYTAFFLGSWIIYLKYRTSAKRKHYLITLGLFLLSLLSKPVAVTMPVILLLTDFYQGRKLTRPVWLEKMPFFILSILFGLLAVLTQKASGNLSGLDFTFFQQLSFASYGFISYLMKVALPFNLSAFYPYPVEHPDAFPLIGYAFPLVVIFLSLMILYTLQKNKLIFFGSVFFAVTIFLVLQWLPVGKAIMADRYTYLPSLGLLFLAAEGVYLLWRSKMKWLGILLSGIFTLSFSFITFERCGVWKDELSLWNDVISKSEKVSLAYLNRGIAYARNNEYDKAISDLSKAIHLDSVYDATGKNKAKAFFNRGHLYITRHEWAKALDDLNKSIESDSENPRAYFNRGNIYSELRDSQKALEDYSKAIELNPDDPKPYINRGLIYSTLNDAGKALKDFDTADILNPDNPETHFNRGLLFLNQGEYEKSIAAFTKSLSIKPEDLEALFNRGYLLIYMKKYREAIEDFTKVIELHPEDPRGFYYRGLAWYYTADKPAAEEDLQKACAMGYQPAITFLRTLTPNREP